MIPFIEDIINRFGGRLAGSESEFLAQEYLRTQLDTFCTETTRHDFTAPLNAKPDSLKLFCIGYYIALGLFWVNLWAAFALALVNTILYLGHFVLYQGWLSFLWKKEASLSITGILEPQGEVKSTILIAGHMDSTREFTWWYWFGNFGIKLTLISGFLLLLLPVLYLVLLLSSSNGLMPHWGTIIWWIFLALTPTTLSMLFMRGKRVVPGAQDNLSGIAVAFETVRHFVNPNQKGESVLQHTRLKMVSFGSEETGLCGSEAYANAFADELKKEDAILINLDGIMNMDEFHVLKKELMGGIHYAPSLVKKISTHFESLGLTYRNSTLTVGATDGASLQKAGIPSATILGLPIDRLDPTYHTRRDLPEFIDPKAMESCKSVLINFIKEWDQE